MWWIKPVGQQVKQEQLPFTKVCSWIHAIPSGNDRKRIKYLLLHQSTHDALVASGMWEFKTLYGYPVAIVSDGFPEGALIGDEGN